MSLTPSTVAAFETWKLAELAAHYAAPCPEEVMNDLVDRAGEKFDALMAMPVASANDLILKLFPLLLRDMEPRAGDPPLRPVASKSYAYEDAFYARLVADLAAVSTHLSDAIETPHKYARQS